MHSKWRNFARDPFDWAFSELNLGLAYNRRHNGDRRKNLNEAITHSGNASEGFGAANASMHHAQALHVSAEKLTLAQLHSVEDETRLRLLDEAAEDARRSLEMRSLAMAPLDAGRTWRQLAAVLAVREDPAGAIEAYQMALQGLTPTTAPRPCRDAARGLAALASTRDDWVLAAQAWETAAEAAASATDARATHRGRLDELRENLNIFRFAAYALTRVGRSERAVELLELGRGRELRVWLQHDALDLAHLQELDPSLHHRFVDLQSQLDDIERRQRADLHSSSTDAATVSEDLAETVAAIRALPGFVRFREHPTFHEIAAAAAPGEALVYIASSPDGAVALIVTTDKNGPTVTAIETNRVTSTEIVRVFLGFDVERGELTGHVGYLIAHRQVAYDAMDAALAQFGQLLGRPLPAPLEAALRSRHIHTISLIPSGLLGLLPLHAIIWEDEDVPRCLIEEFDVIFAASAFSRSVCRRRAGRQREPRRNLSS